jgi:exonuclease III
MFDGSLDDMIDGTSCSSIVLPAAATVNGIRVSLFTQADYEQVISILGRFNNDQDTVTLQFLKVKTSTYTKVVNSQSEYNAIVNGCTTAQSSGQNAISSLKSLSQQF